MRRNGYSQALRSGLHNQPDPESFGLLGLRHVFRTT